MQDYILQQLVEDISLTFFKLPFKHQASFNGRLRTTGGRYLLKTHNIEINPKQLEVFGEDALVGIIKHELCHYHLHLQKKGYQHKDKEFQQLLAEVGGSRYCKLIPQSRRENKVVHVFECCNCKLPFERKRNIDTKKYVCGKCRGRIRKVETFKLS